MWWFSLLVWCSVIIQTLVANKVHLLPFTVITRRIHIREERFPLPAPPHPLNLLYLCVGALISKVNYCSRIELTREGNVPCNPQKCNGRKKGPWGNGRIEFVPGTPFFRNKKGRLSRKIRWMAFLSRHSDIQTEKCMGEEEFAGQWDSMGFYRKTIPPNAVLPFFFKSNLQFL